MRGAGSNASEAALPLSEFGQGRVQIAGVEIRPHSIGKQEFGICGLPDQEV
jgi:hypothetical protein